MIFVMECFKSRTKLHSYAYIKCINVELKSLGVRDFKYVTLLIFQTL